MERPVCAVATVPGHSAIAVLRLTGKKSISLFEKIFRPLGKSNKLSKNPRVSVYGKIVYDNKTMDDVLATCFKAPASYTGEDMVEIYCHGNFLIIKNILKTLYKIGFEPASAGEFSRRSVLNGKMDLTQAEAIRNIIEARGENELQKARLMQEGSFRKELLRFRSDLLNLAADFTAEFDFSDEDIQFQSKSQKISSLMEIQNQVKQLLEDSDKMQILRHGYNAVIIGAPNAGKSSLLNYIIGTDRAIVSDIPGTTRDYLESELQIGGMPVNFIDTAGIRKSKDETEKIGIGRSKAQYRQADIGLLVIDSSIAPEAQDLAEISNLIEEVTPKQLVVVLNKCDIVDSKWEAKQSDIKQVVGNNLMEANFSKKVLEKVLKKVRFVSVKTGENLNGFKQDLDAIVANLHPHTAAILLSPWQRELMDKILMQINEAIELTNLDELPEITASCLQNCLDFIGQLTGEITNEDLLGRIFSRFCIGK